CESPVAARRLAPPRSQYEIAAVMPAADDAGALSRRNRTLYIVLLVVFYATITVGVVLTARGIYREAKLSRLKTDFVSAISHELRTPLTSIRMFVETLELGRARDDAEVKECLHLLARETERLTSMIERVLDWARIESGRKIYRRSSVPVREVVDGALAAFRTQLLAAGSANDANLKLVVEVPDGLPPLHCDPEAMGGVLLNILQNAYKYTGVEKRIEVRARASGRKVELEVQDNGPGIAKADRKRIFERFYRADDLLTRKTEGTGLGLSIAMRIVQAHGGKLKVRSEKGAGSVFTVSLPAERVA
ncbi:MAG: sensor histidine kinase, partial [Myxococcales bacterium]